ncbi:peptidase M23, partial [Micromonospora azadirachtae]
AAPAGPDADPDVRAMKKPAEPAPVAGLTRTQMKNAEIIVRTGRGMGVPRRGLVIAVATAMQESNLYNLASGVIPESQRHPHQGLGWDHDSVGLFQQRSSSGWGPVDRLMDPEFATRQFLGALERVPGWQQMRLTDAAQAVQVSAYPDHYAKHEWRANEVVDAILPTER